MPPNQRIQQVQDRPDTRLSSAREFLQSRPALLWLAAGLVLRLLCIAFPRQADDDTFAYLELGRNLLHRGTYGFLDDGTVSPALFRLPGYPIFLALLGGRMMLIFLAQSLIALGGCVLLASFLYRYRTPRAAISVLAISATCVFTAVYDATALTESLSVFAVAAAIYALGRFLARPDAFTGDGFSALVALAASAALAMLLRPDGAIVTIAAAVALAYYGLRRAGLSAALRTAAVFCLLAFVPLVPWAIRNAVTFHVFQPLAPRHVNDPGERVNLGFYRWLRTWSVDFETTCLVFWHVGAETIDPASLPPRAFDSPRQRVETIQLIDDYNLHHDVDETLDARFAAMAATRIREHPLRYFVWVPAARVADMWLRPRTEGIPVDPSWWRYSEHPRETIAAAGIALLNLIYIAAALVGTTRRPPLAVFLASYLLLRCLLLATIENPEPRYTLEAFPIVFVLAAVAVSRLDPTLHRKYVKSG